MIRNVSILNQYSDYLLDRYSNLPRGRYVSLLIVRKTESETIFRNEGSGEGLVKETVIAGIQSTKPIRRGAALHYIMQNPRRLDADSSKKATLFVVNPDIFYYTLYSCYGRNDRIPLFQDILTLCNYIVIDEFHYYDAKQFANFLFFMRLSQHYGFTERQFCLLTATPNERVTTYLERLFGKENIAWITPESGEGFAQTEKAQALSEVTLEVYDEQTLRDGLLTLP